MTQKKLAVVCTTLAFGAGGMERTAANVANAMSARGWDVNCIFRDNENRPPLYPLAPGVTQSKLRRTAFVSACAKVIARFDPDVCLVLYSTCDLVRLISTIAALDVPLVFHEGSNPGRVVGENWSKRKDIALSDAQRERDAICAHAVRVRVTLPQYRNAFPEFLKPDVVTFPNAFAPAEGDPGDLRRTTARNRFINIGGLKKVKNLPIAIEAFARMAADFPDWDFTVFSAIPQNTETYLQTQAIISRYDLGSRVILNAPVQDIYSEYARSDIHVIASFSEGLPNCIAEAMCNALPSIGFSTCPGTNILIEHEKNGLLADSAAPVQALEQAMRRLARDQELRERLGAQALTDSAMFDPRTVFDQWEEMLGAAAEKKPQLARYKHERLTRAGADAPRYRHMQRMLAGFAPEKSPPHVELRDKPLVSFIVPVFDKIDFVEETLRSIRDNTYPNKQVIVVDDASRDGSLEISRRFCDENDGWTLIGHAQNAGLSAARNSGLERAQGEYIQFWDADDVYHPDGLSRAMDKADRNGSDIVTCIATRKKKVLARYAPAMETIDRGLFVDHPQALAAASVCFKIYRKRFLDAHGFSFTPGMRMQDSEFNLMAFALAPCITMTPYILGDYRLVKTSGSRQFTDDKYRSTLMIADNTEAFYREHWLHPVEDLRQRHLLTHVFWMFVGRALQALPASAQSCTAAGLDAIEPSWAYLEEVRRRLPRYARGIRALGKEHPQKALVYGALQAGMLPWARALSGPDPARAGIRPEQMPEAVLTRSQTRQALDDLRDQLAALQAPASGMQA